MGGCRAGRVRGGQGFRGLGGECGGLQGGEGGCRAGRGAGAGGTAGLSIGDLYGVVIVITGFPTQFLIMLMAYGMVHSHRSSSLVLSDASCPKYPPNHSNEPRSSPPCQVMFGKWHAEHRACVDAVSLALASIWPWRV